MPNSKLTQSLSSLKWLSLRKFCFWFSLKTGIQVYGFLSFIISIFITDNLLVSLIESQICAGYRRDSELLHCQLTRQRVLPQACQAVMSALLLCFLKKPAVPLCWLGSRLAVRVSELGYLVDCSRDLLFQLLSLHVHPALFIILFVVFDLYGVIVAFSYYTELNGNQASYTLGLQTKIAETNIDIPIPPALPNF